MFEFRYDPGQLAGENQYKQTHDLLQRLAKRWGLSSDILTVSGVKINATTVGRNVIRWMEYALRFQFGEEPARLLLIFTDTGNWIAPSIEELHGTDPPEWERVAQVVDLTRDFQTQWEILNRVLRAFLKMTRDDLIESANRDFRMPNRVVKREAAELIKSLLEREADLNNN